MRFAKWQTIRHDDIKQKDKQSTLSVISIHGQQVYFWTIFTNKIMAILKCIWLFEMAYGCFLSLSIVWSKTQICETFITVFVSAEGTRYRMVWM